MKLTREMLKIGILISMQKTKKNDGYIEKIDGKFIIHPTTFSEK